MPTERTKLTVNAKDTHYYLLHSPSALLLFVCTSTGRRESPSLPKHFGLETAATLLRRERARGRRRRRRIRGERESALPEKCCSGACVVRSDGPEKGGRRRRRRKGWDGMGG